MRSASAFGSYVPGTSFLHRLDARVKLVSLAALSVSLFFCSSLPVVAFVAAASVAIAAGSGVPLKSLAASCIPLFVVLTVAFASNALVNAAAADIALAGPVGLSVPGVVRGALFTLRVFSLVVMTLAVCATTSVGSLSRAFSWMLRPLSRVIPSDDVAMTLTLAIRFIPIAQQELARIRDAQAARGLLPPDAALAARLRSWGAAFVPLVVGLFARADAVADAMRDRCYGSRPRAREADPIPVPSRIALAATLAASVLIAMV